MFNIDKLYIKYSIMQLHRWSFALFIFALTQCVFAQDIIDDDPRRKAVYEQPRLPVIGAILLIHYDKGDAEELYNLYKSNPGAFNQIEVKYEDFVDTYRFTNPNGWNKPPTVVRYWKRLRKTGSDSSFFRLFGLGKSFAERQLGLLSEQVAKIPPYEASAATSNREPTSLELRAMQTRRFSKSPWEMVSAIEEFFKDKNGQCVLVAPRFTPIGLSNKYENGVTRSMVDGYALQKGQGSCMMHGSIYEFEITTPAPKAVNGQQLPFDPGMFSGQPTQFKFASTDLRVRIKQGGRQRTDAQSYQTLFKLIADQAFIEAIEVDPAPME